MLWVYDNYKYFNSFSSGTVFVRQNLTSSDVGLSVQSLNILSQVQENYFKRFLVNLKSLGHVSNREKSSKIALGKCLNQHFLNDRRDHMVNLVFCIIFIFDHVGNNVLVS